MFCHLEKRVYSKRKEFFFFFFFDLGFTALSRIFHLYRADRSSKMGENRSTRRKTTWPSVSRTWLSHIWPELGSNHSGEKPNGLRVNSLIHQATGAHRIYPPGSKKAFRIYSFSDGTLLCAECKQEVTKVVSLFKHGKKFSKSNPFEKSILIPIAVSKKWGRNGEQCWLWSTCSYRNRLTRVYIVCLRRAVWIIRVNPVFLISPIKHKLGWDLSDESPQHTCMFLWRKKNKQTKNVYWYVLSGGLFVSILQ